MADDDDTPVAEVQIDNWQRVAIGGRADSIGDVIVERPRVQMTRDEALVHAAWIIAVTVGRNGGDRFEPILRRVLDEAEREHA